MKLLFYIQSFSIIFIAVRAIDPTIICHGGAGSISESSYVKKYRGTIHAVQTGYEILRNSGSPVDAVEEAIKTMELNENFNAGYGSALNSDGEVEMDACIMDGSNMKVGAVTGAKNIFHAITLARRVMEKTKYNFLGAPGSIELSKTEGFEILPPGRLAIDLAVFALKRWKEFHNVSHGELGSQGGTVGCVAIDSNGNLAAGTSTGGLTGKMPGRIGDTPVIGSGTYANNYMGALSATGNGEAIMKSVLAYDILMRVNLTDISIQTASQKACDEMKERYDGTGGVVGLDKNGNIAIGFSSNQMSWAYQRNENLIHYGINHGDDYLYDIQECKSKNCFE